MVIWRMLLETRTASVARIESVMVSVSSGEDETRLRPYGVFGTTLVTFFLAEMGDKTQVATIALAAKFHALVAVVCGTTLGLLIADVPAVYVGDRIAGRLPVRQVHIAAAALFAALGIATLLGIGKRFGL